MFQESAVGFIQKSSIGIHAVSPKGIIKYANQFELDILGYLEEEYVGHHVSEFQINDKFLNDMMEKLGEFKNLINYPSRVQGKNEIKYILYNSSVYEQGGEFIHTRCFGCEISQKVYEVLVEESAYLKG
jgi:hypothetical protein